MNTKKYFITASLIAIAIAALSFSGNLAFAAQTVKGTIPEVKPLQPAPPGVYPDVSNNIQHTSQEKSASDNNNIGKSGELLPENVAPVTVQPAAGNQTSRKNSTSIWVLVVILAVGGASLAYILFRGNSKKKE
jgi:flagellar basal body-associated protein FliL